MKNKHKFANSNTKNSYLKYLYYTCTNCLIKSPLFQLASFHVFFIGVGIGLFVLLLAGDLELLVLDSWGTAP